MCKHLVYRSNKKIKTKYCRLKKEWNPVCQGCENKSYKEYKQIVAKTPLKAKSPGFDKKSPVKSGLKPYSKKRICVSKQTYKVVFDECDGKCALCGTTETLQYHHIKYRSEAKHLIDEPTNGIMLCMNCHKLVHRNKKLWQPKLLGFKEQKHGIEVQ